MIEVTIAEAQQRLPELLADVQAGEAVEIRGAEGRTFRLIASRPRPAITGVPRAGSCQGIIEMADDFDAPLDELREYME
jgi:antitoxin (DNA-binding transcriptional repressor) of toxin-antitoxin stability system